MSANGQILGGRYRLERLLGSGGFADVYLATDTGPLGRSVAVKLLHPHLVRQQDFLDRFKREAATVAQLKHAHILDVYDYGEHDGTPYLVMPYIPGGTLGDRLRAAHRLDLPQAVAYLWQIAAALDYAHARRVIHRDLKPQNFLVDDGDHLLLTDFGIARLMQEASLASGGSIVVGTLPYMAPELFQGQPGMASDRYALGCMAYQFLAGVPPYAGTTEQLMFAHSFSPVPALVERGGAHLPAALDAVLAQALAKRPEDRYPSAAAFARAFEAAVAGLDSARQEAGDAPTIVVPPPQASPEPPTVLGPQLVEPDATPLAPVVQSAQATLPAEPPRPGEQDATVRGVAPGSQIAAAPPATAGQTSDRETRTQPAAALPDPAIRPVPVTPPNARPGRAWHGRLGVALLVLGICLLAILIAPIFAPYGPDEVNFKNKNATASSAHLMGTDDLGRDLFSRRLYALRMALPGRGPAMAILAVLSTTTGVIVLVRHRRAGRSMVGSPLGT